MPTGGFIGYAPGIRANGNAGAASIYLTALTAQQNGTATAVLLDCFGATASTTFKALVYDGAHSALLASSATFTSSVIHYNRFPLTAPLAITAGTTYYVGYVCSTSFAVGVQTGGGTAWFASGGQSVTSPANPLTTGASATNPVMIALELDGAGSAGYGFSPDQASGVVLSSSNTVATFSAIGHGARSLVTQNPNIGKWYAEIVAGGTLNATNGIGLSSVNWGVTQRTVQLSYVNFLLPSGVVQSNSGAPSIGLTYASGDIVGIAYDAVNQLAWWNKNNGGWVGATAGNPVTATNGFSILPRWPYAISVATGATASAAVFTLRDRASALQYAPPSGFSAWAPPPATAGQYAVSVIV